jgi:4-hydroxy-3-polyprenylbenzoate decarboxylase
MTAKPRLVIGLSGASGIVFGVRLLECLRTLPVESHLVMTRTAEVTLAAETALKVAEVRALADVVHRNDDLAAAISSGSFRTLGMIVVPAAAAQQAADRLVAAGVDGIVNFAPVTLVLPPHVQNVGVDLAIELEQLSFAVTNKLAKSAEPAGVTSAHDA